MARRSRSMRPASAGRMSSMYSGRSQARMSGAFDRKENRLNYRPLSGADEVEQKKPREHRAEPYEADLPVAHFGEPPERLAPQRGHQERQDAFDDEHERERGEQRVAHEAG